MDKFKEANITLATAWDWNAPRFVTRTKGDGRKLRRYARRKLKNKLKKIINNELFEKSWR
jgi:hypothetical protein